MQDEPCTLDYTRFHICIYAAISLNIFSYIKHKVLLL